ncbi:MAG: hypothetical protein M1588_02260 [Planctomycetes bacterium]|nr:hypothetical protein [Planctomycetota bacterium]
MNIYRQTNCSRTLYSTYQTVLHNALPNNPRLLIVGYGFGDLHFNRLLSRLTRIHEDGRRVVLIGWVLPGMRGEYWAPDANFMEWPGAQAIQCMARLSRQDDLFGRPLYQPLGVAR